LRMSGWFAFHWLLGSLRRSSVCHIFFFDSTQPSKVGAELLPLAVVICIADIARKNDESGVLTKMIEEHGMSIAEGSTHLVKIIEESTREKDGGEFVNFDGSRLEW
jgi:hypothetical protein